MSERDELKSRVDKILKQMVADGVCELSVDENGEFTFFMNDEQKNACDERRQSGQDLMGRED